MPVIPELGKLRQKDCVFKASLGYTVRPPSQIKIYILIKSRCQWRTPVIPATQEAEIKRITKPVPGK
jgi:hypothetical protein